MVISAVETPVAAGSGFSTEQVRIVHGPRSGQTVIVSVTRPGWDLHWADVESGPTRTGVMACPTG